MSKTCFIFAITALILIEVDMIAAAQVSIADTANQQTTVIGAERLLNSALGEQFPIYNGREYYLYDPHIKSNAYFMDVGNFTNGSILYDGVLCNGVPMLYDLYTDEVAAMLYNHFSTYQLVKEKVKYFDFLGHHFININSDSLEDNTLIKSGFYDELYNGKLQVLVKREKTIQETNGNALGPERYFTTPSRAIFLRERNGYYSITNEKSLLNIFKDKKKELQRFIRSSQIKFKKDPENSTVKICSFYEHLTNH